MALFLAHAVRRKFFHNSGFLDCFFRINREVNRGIDPSADLRVVRSISGAGCALDDVAIPRAECGLTFRRLSGPEVLLLEEVLVVESGAARMSVANFKGQRMGNRFAGMNDLDRVVAVGTHLYKNKLAQIAMRRGIVCRGRLS